MSDTPSFSLELREQAVILNGKEGPVEYKLREMDGDSRDKYLNSQNAKVKIQDGKAVGLRTFEGCQSSLLSRCLFRDDILVPEKVIQSFPSSVLQKLFDLAQEINLLNDTADKEAKNG
jgi:hypothetical protein